MRIDKPWGHEFIWANTAHYIGKILYVEPGQRLSLQRHEHKDETLLLMEGSYVFVVGEFERERLTQHRGYRIRPRVIHRIHNEGADAAVILEVSTPHIGDVVRIEDDYGRVALTDTMERK